ncbi:C-type mannose receptor 2-like [Apostichopus japonicus]|uniref:C-type mannose receptor 2-like n=1 Tax=Stichopus japonicus TaxID=307972 RepID=UPI003AB90BE3
MWTLNLLTYSLTTWTVLVVLRQAFSQASPSDCPSDWLALDGHCYHHPQKTVTWNEADVWCNSYGARILVLETEEERVAVRDIIDLSNMWLGCNDKDIESNWICYSDTLAEFWSWSNGGPTDSTGVENCLYVEGTSLKDENCLSLKSFLCEGEPAEMYYFNSGVQCPFGWLTVAGKCYFQAGGIFKWLEAEIYCNSFGGNLLVVDSEDEVLAISETFSPLDQWIGCSDQWVSGDWICNGKDLTSFSAWAVDQPARQGCATLNDELGLKAEDCNNKKDFFCEVSLQKLTTEVFGICPPGWVELQDACYFFRYKTNTWDLAEEYCLDAVSTLVTFEAAEERDIVRSFFPNRDVWIGCNNRDSVTKWDCQGTIEPFLDFDDNEPSTMLNENCLVMTSSGKFRSDNCENNYYFVCKMPKDQYLGCYLDQSNRALVANFVALNGLANVYNCMVICNAMNYVIVGLQYSSQCFCGNELYSHYGQYPEWQCLSTCRGQDRQFCGGTWRQSVYRVGSKAASVSRLYKASKRKRLKESVYATVEVNSITACALACTASVRCLSFNLCKINESSTDIYNCELSYKITRFDVTNYEDNLNCTYAEIKPP